MKRHLLELSNTNSVRYFRHAEVRGFQQDGHPWHKARYYGSWILNYPTLHQETHSGAGHIV